MLINDIKIMNGTKSTVSSFVGSVLFYQRHNCGAGAVHMALLNHFIEFASGLREGEIDALVVLVVSSDQFTCQQIQRRAEIVNYIAYNSRKVFWHFFSYMNRPFFSAWVAVASRFHDQVKRLSD